MRYAINVNVEEQNHGVGFHKYDVVIQFCHDADGTKGKLHDANVCSVK